MAKKHSVLPKRKKRPQDLTAYALRGIRRRLDALEEWQELTEEGRYIPSGSRRAQK